MKIAFLLSFKIFYFYLKIYCKTTYKNLLFLKVFLELIPYWACYIIDPLFYENISKVIVLIDVFNKIELIKLRWNFNIMNSVRFWIYIAWKTWKIGKLLEDSLRNLAKVGRSNPSRSKKSIFNTCQTTFHSTLNRNRWILLRIGLS